MKKHKLPFEFGGDITLMSEKEKRTWRIVVYSILILWLFAMVLTGLQ
jgi:hypothetical protein